MPIAVKRESLDLIRQVDDLGKQGLTQEQIASTLGRTSKWALKYELRELGFDWSQENRVRFNANNQRFEDLDRAGEIIPAADPAFAASAAEVAR